MNDMYPNDSNRGSSMMMGFMLGAVVGAAVALMMAPATGEETRRRLGNTARKLGKEGRHRFDQARYTISGLADDTKRAIDSGREAFSRVRSGTGETDMPYQGAPNPSRTTTP